MSEDEEPGDGDTAGDQTDDETGEQATEQQTTGNSSDDTGLDENVAGALAYILGLISGLFFYFTEEDNEFIRFHALQSIIFSVAAFIVYYILNTILFSMFFSPRMWATGGGALFGLFSMLMTLFSLALLVIWLFLMFKAYNGEKYKLPVIGDLAEDNV